MVLFVVVVFFVVGFSVVLFVEGVFVFSKGGDNRTDRKYLEYDHQPDVSFFTILVFPTPPSKTLQWNLKK